MDQGFNPDFYLCKQNAIAYYNNNGTYALLDFYDFQEFKIIKTSNLNVKFPLNAIMQTHQVDGESECYLYFVEQDNSKNLIAHSISFSDLSHTQSDPQQCNYYFKDKNIINQSIYFQNILQIDNQKLNIIKILKEDDKDPQDLNQSYQVFFLYQTNLYFLKQNLLDKSNLIWYSMNDLYFHVVSTGIVAGISTLNEQQIYLFKGSQDNSKIELFKIDLTLPQIYSTIYYVFEINILEQDNFQNNLPFAITVYDYTIQKDFIYWVLIIENYKVKKVLYKLPNYYALMIAQTKEPSSPKCISFLNKVYNDQNQYSILCPKYIVLNNGYQTGSDDRYSIFIQSQSSIIFIQYTSQIKTVVNIFKQQSHNNTLSLSQYLSKNITCISNPNYVSYRINLDEKQHDRIVEVFCQMDSSNYYILYTGLKQHTIKPSNLMSYLGYGSLGLFIIILTGFLFILFYKTKSKNQIIRDLYQCQQEKKKYVLNQEQFNEKYEILEDKSLGRGTFGSVFECIEKPSKIALMYNKNLKEQKRAVKKVIIRKEIAQEQLQEVYLLDRLQMYPNVIRLINYFYLPDKQLFIILELAQESLEQQIQERVKEKKHYTKQEILDFCKQIGFLMRDLHNKQAITHRDLKPQNILIANDTYKLSDFGAARQLSLEDFYRQNTHVGSLKWMSPEMREGVEQNNIIQKYKLNYYQCDVFSLGLILMRMITLDHIDGVNTEEAMKDFKVKKMMEKRKDLGTDLLKVVEDMLIFDLKTRIDMSAFKSRIESIIKDMLDETQQLESLLEEQDDQHVIITGGSGVRNVSKEAENASINTLNFIQKKQN